MLNIILLGGGNSTHCLAPLISASGNKVTIVTRKPENWSDEITVINEDLNWLKENSIKCKPIITSDYSVVKNADIVWIAGVPIHHNPDLIKKIKPYLSKEKHIFIGSICAYGGFDWVVEKELGKPNYEFNYSVFGTQLIPWCCGTKEYGKVGVIYGAKRLLRIATTDNDSKNIKKILQPILKQELVDTDFLASSLWPNNSSLHPPILYGLFKDWDGETVLNPENLPTLIYAEMTKESGYYVVEMDKELNNIVEALRIKFPNNQNIKCSFFMKKCVLENYEDQISDKSTTISCIMTNSAFGQHKIPYKKKENGVVPIIDHKFFITDLPFGLILFKDLALTLNVNTPIIDRIIEWNQKLIKKEYLVNGRLIGKDINEAIVPSKITNI